MAKDALVKAEDMPNADAVVASVDEAGTAEADHEEIAEHAQQPPAGAEQDGETTDATVEPSQASSPPSEEPAGPVVPGGNLASSAATITEDVAAFEAQLVTLRDDVTRLQAELEAANARAATAEDALAALEESHALTLDKLTDRWQERWDRMGRPRLTDSAWLAGYRVVSRVIEEARFNTLSTRETEEAMAFLGDLGVTP